MVQLTAPTPISTFTSKGISLPAAPRQRVPWGAGLQKSRKDTYTKPKLHPMPSPSSRHSPCKWRTCCGIHGPIGQSKK